MKNPVDADKLRLKVDFGIDYSDDIQDATEIILDEAEKHENIRSDLHPSVRLVSLDDSSVGLQARIWISDPNRADYVRTRGEFTTSVKSRFDEVGIEFPFPQRDLSGEIEMQS